MGPKMVSEIDEIVVKNETENCVEKPCQKYVTVGALGTSLKKIA